jgi:type IV pilus assembly protein PilY1
MKTCHRFDLATKPMAAVLGTVLGLASFAFDAAAATTTTTDISSTPMVTTAPNAVKPNVMFILDDSGSMGNDYMPDDAGFASGKYGRYASQCNGLAYNPNLAGGYKLPVDSTGADMLAGAYTFISPSALPNIRSVLSTAPSIASSTTTLTLTLSAFGNNAYSVNNLITLYSNDDQAKYMVGVITAVDAGNDKLTVRFTDFKGSGTITNPRVGDGDFRPFYFTYNTYTGSPAKLSYSYTSGAVDTASTFYRECDSVVGDTSATGNGRFSKVVLDASSMTDDYRNWYTYYRTRMLMMRTSTSLAFKGIGDKYRVGFSTISSTSVDGSLFLDVADFDATQKATWYTRLFNSPPTGWTPLRGALSKAGRYFSKYGKLADGSAQTYDPMQFSCQKNFAILTTDGYWNTGQCYSNGTCDAGSETSTYGPYRLDGAAIGQQDGSAARPMRDSGVETYTVTTPMSQLKHWLRTRTQTRTTTEQYTEYRTTGSSCSGSRSKLQQRVTSRTRTQTNTEISRDRSTQTYDSVVTYTGGTASSPVIQNVVNGAYSSDGATTSSGFTGNSWSSWNTSSWSDASGCSPSTTVPSPNPTATTSNTGAASAWSSYSAYTPTTPTESVVATGPAVESAHTSTGGSSDSLADVAMYYYQTDLRTAALGNCTLSNGTDVCENNITPRGADDAAHQHLTTFTLGLGVNGTLGYDPNYLGGQSADYQAIIAGTKNWPNPSSNAGAVNIDDLWHAAVNGRGQYFSAGDPGVLATSLSDTLAAIEARTGTASAAATSTLQPVSGDNTEYVTSYTTVQWFGDVVAFSVDPETGARSATSLWSAQKLLDDRIAAGTARSIYYMKRDTGANTGTLRTFTESDLLSDGLAGNFENVCSKSPALSQCTGSTYDVTGANNRVNLIAWLRGGNDSRYRTRVHKLGDTVGGAPVFVRKPPFAYSENNYESWVASINASNSGAGRTGAVYVPANDGMLHAFDGASGEELWAYVPSMVMDRLYKLADSDYATKHEYFVNATPVVGDIWVPAVGATPGTWKTILVGGLGAGGRGYYALDITDPNSPKALWEFTNDSQGGNGNLGLTFGNPVITKRANGTWVVAFASGYNNVSPGDGNGRLFVVNANTGALVDVGAGTPIGEVQTYTAPSVPAGTTAAPSGLAKINNWVESPRDNTSLRYYAGDLLGNLWRFDIDGVVAPHNAALRLAQLRAGSPAAAQPITTRPEVGVVTQGGVNYPVVYVATGKLLGLSDLSNSAQQSVYAIKDPLTNTELGDVHARSDVVAQTLTENTSTHARTVTSNPVDWSSKIGWRVDLVTTGERVNIDMRLALTTLVVGSNAPSNNACVAGGTSYLYQLNIASGGALPGASGVAGVWLGNSYAVGIGLMQLYSQANGGAGTGDTIVRLQRGDSGVSTSRVDPLNSSTVNGRRTSWRELVN